MKNDRHVQLRLPARVVAAVIVEAESSGRTVSAVMRDTITESFPGFDGGRYNPEAARADMRRRLRAVTRIIFDPRRAI